MLIPFNKPSVGPQSESDSIAFNKMPEILKVASASVGWAISLGNSMKEEIAYIQKDLSERVRQKLVRVEARLTTGYATLLYFVEKVMHSLVNS